MRRSRAQKKRKEREGGVEKTKDKEKKKVTPQGPCQFPLCSPCTADAYASPTAPREGLTELFSHHSKHPDNRSSIPTVIAQGLTTAFLVNIGPKVAI